MIGGRSASSTSRAASLRRFSTPNSKGLQMKTLMTRLWKEEEGQDLVEYGLLLALITAITIAAVKNIGTWIQGAFQNTYTNLT